MTNHKYIPKKLPEYRKAEKLTQDKFSEKIGVTCAHYSKIESGIKVPSLEMYIQIVNALGLRSDELLTKNLEDENYSFDDLFENISNLSLSEINLLYDIFQGIVKCLHS